MMKLSNAAFATLLTAAPAWAQVGPVPASEVDLSLYCAGKHSSLLYYATHKVSGLFSYSVSGMKVRAAWGWRADNAGTNPGFVTDYPVTYRPSAVIEYSDTEIIVAGIDSGWATRIEKWTFGQPITSTYMELSGNTVNVLTAPPVIDKEVLFIDRTGAEGPIAMLLPNYGSTANVLVQFFGSRTIYTLDVIAKTMTLQLAGTDPQLGGVFSRYWAVDHPTKGYLYFLYGQTTPLATPNFTVVFDSGKNGTLDGASALVDDDLITLGFNGGSTLLDAKW